jgi:hypothetical protein
MKRLNKPALRAIEAAGGVAELARALLAPNHSYHDFVRMQHRISKWRLNGVAPKWVLPVSKVTGVPSHELCPTLYPKGIAA